MNLKAPPLAKQRGGLGPPLAQKVCRALGATKIPATTINESTDTTTSEETMPASIMMDILLNNDTSCEDEDGMLQVTTFRAIQESVE